MTHPAKAPQSASLAIAGGLLLPTIRYPESLGTNVLHWFGDALPRDTGSIPSGYLSGPYYKQWIRGQDNTTSWFSRGPYQVLQGTGSFRIKLFMLAPVNARNAGQSAFYVDVCDTTVELSHPGQGVLASHTFSVAELPSNSDAFAVISTGPHTITSGHTYETRVRAGGGADLYIYLLHWEIDTL